MKDVMIVTGAGQISLAITRRMGAGKKIVVGDKVPAHSVAGALGLPAFEPLAAADDPSAPTAAASCVSTGRTP